MENTNDVQVASNRGSFKITGQERGVLQEMIWLDRNRAVTNVLTEPQIGSTKGLLVLPKSCDLHAVQIAQSRKGLCNLPVSSPDLSVIDV